jgi:hypothetical protein
MAALPRTAARSAILYFSALFVFSVDSALNAAIQARQSNHRTNGIQLNGERTARR